MPSRHLGLHMGHEFDDDIFDIPRLIDSIEHHLDLDNILRIAKGKKRALKPIQYEPREKPVRLAVAHDEAFCFYYPQNLDILKTNGIQPVYFSPLHDRACPDEVSGIYLGGGYPELHARKLSENSTMIDSIKNFANRGGFIYGECGGFMYMCEKLKDAADNYYPMTGIFPVTVQMKKRLSSLGYRETTTLCDSLLGEEGTVCYGHEFHYSEIIDRDIGIDFLYHLQDGRKEGCVKDNCLGSYVHLHFARSETMIRSI